jgi:hypothetical protein
MSKNTECVCIKFCKKNVKDGDKLFAIRMERKMITCQLMQTAFGDATTNQAQLSAQFHYFRD